MNYKNVISALLFFIIIIATGCSNSQVTQSTTENESDSEIATDNTQNKITARKIADNVYLTYPDDTISHNAQIYNGVRVSCDYDRIKDIFKGNIEVAKMSYINKTAYNFVSDYNEIAWFVEANSFYYYTENGSLMEVAGEELASNESLTNFYLNFLSREKVKDEVVQSLKKLGIDADFQVHMISSISKSDFEKYIL
ncbi:hypothetical protein FACS189499_04690 [Clostridia bacterium]|nr:hypothetical protein FACS189499_04690 [Clostridia bacterium]